MFVDFGTIRGGVREYSDLRAFSESMRHEGREWLKQGAIAGAGVWTEVAAELSSRLIEFSGEISEYLIEAGVNGADNRVLSARKRITPILVSSQAGQELLGAMSDNDIDAAQRIISNLEAQAEPLIVSEPVVPNLPVGQPRLVSTQQMFGTFNIVSGTPTAHDHRPAPILGRAAQAVAAQPQPVLQPQKMPQPQQLAEPQQAPDLSGLTEVIGQARRELDDIKRISHEARNFEGIALENAKRLEDVKREMVQAEADRSAQWARAMALYDQRLKIPDTTHIWERRAEIHRAARGRLGKWAMVAAIGTLCISILAASLLFRSAGIITGEDGAEMAGYRFIFGATATLLIFCMCAWGTSILIRLAYTEHHLALDADARTALAEAYVGMASEGRLDKEEQGVMLASMFRATSFK